MCYRPTNFSEKASWTNKFSANYAVAQQKNVLWPNKLRWLCVVTQQTDFWVSGLVRGDVSKPQEGEIILSDIIVLSKADIVIQYPITAHQSACTYIRSSLFFSGGFFATYLGACTYWCGAKCMHYQLNHVIEKIRILMAKNGWIWMNF